MLALARPIPQDIILWLSDSFTVFKFILSSLQSGVSLSIEIISEFLFELSS